MQFFMHQIMNFYSYIVSAALLFWGGIKGTVADFASTTYNSNITVNAFYDQVSLLDSMANVTFSSVRNNLCDRTAACINMTDISTFVPVNVTYILTSSLRAIPTTTLSPGDILLTILNTSSDFYTRLSMFARTLLDFLSTHSVFGLLVACILVIAGALSTFWLVYDPICLWLHPKFDWVDKERVEWEKAKLDSSQPKPTSTAVVKVSRTPPANDLIEQLSEARKAVAKVLQDLANLSLFHRGVVRAREGVVKERGRLIEGGR